MDKFNNKYRIASARAAWWNYGWAGAYFITICTKDRHHFFGEIIDGVMHLSHLGILVDVLWHEIPNHAKNVELGAFQVMPNHLHGILILGGNHDDGVDPSDPAVETRHALSLQIQPQPQQPQQPQQNPPPPNQTPAQQRYQNQGRNTVSSIIGSFKSAVTKHANRLGLPNGWQSRFHDHLIRDDAEYQRINDYTENNPKNWKDDRFFGNKN